MRKVYLGILLCFVLAACSPVTISKCHKEYKYDGDKVKSEYTECLTQTPEKTLPIHLKHQELYE
jgi:hypothetical protein